MNLTIRERLEAHNCVSTAYLLCDLIPRTIRVIREGETSELGIKNMLCDIIRHAGRSEFESFEAGLNHLSVVSCATAGTMAQNAIVNGDRFRTAERDLGGLLEKLNTNADTWLRS